MKAECLGFIGFFHYLCKKKNRLQKPMLTMKRIIIMLTALLVCLLSAPTTMAQTGSLPRMERKQGTWQLTVDGQPFLMLGGELHN